MAKSIQPRNVPFLKINHIFYTEVPTMRLAMGKALRIAKVAALLSRLHCCWNPRELMRGAWTPANILCVAGSQAGRHNGAVKASAPGWQIQLHVFMAM
jgi:hypothetical protein